MTGEVPPGYVALVERMCGLIGEWYQAQPARPDLRWLDWGDTLFAGVLQGDALKYLADSPDAFRLLEWLGEQTGQKFTGKPFKFMVSGGATGLFWRCHERLCPLNILRF